VLRTITGLTEQRPNSGRYVVFVDGAPAAIVNAQTIADLALGVGRSLDERELDRLRDAAAGLAVFDKALELLAVRPRSVRELRTRLTRHGVGEAHVAWAIARLTSLGYLNDADYAREVAHVKMVQGGMSKRRLQQELFRRGVARTEADAAIQETLEAHEVDERGAALAAARRRLAALRNVEPDVRRRRLHGFLARRGYEYDVIADVLREALGEASRSSEDDAGDDASE
jgi:regulatory protein